MIFFFPELLTAIGISELREGDMCIITNCPPVSARKRFKLESIIKRASSTNSEAGGEAIKMSAELPPNSG